MFILMPCLARLARIFDEQHRLHGLYIWPDQLGQHANNG